MIVNYPLLGLALLLLWFPRQWLRFGGFRTGGRGNKRQREWTPRGQREPGDMSIWCGEEIRKPRNWVDLFRALAGSIAVGQVVFTPPDRPDSFFLLLVLTLKVAIFITAILIQTLRFEGKATLFAPLFYIQGLAFGLVGLKFQVAFFALAAVWVLNTVLPSAAVFLFVYAGLLICFGMILGDRSGRKEIALAAGLALVPGLLSLIFKRRLAQFTKKTKIVEGSSSSSAAPTP